MSAASAVNLQFRRMRIRSTNRSCLRRVLILLVLLCFSAYSLVPLASPYIAIGSSDRVPFSRGKTYSSCPIQLRTQEGDNFSAKAIMMSALLRVFDEAMTRAQPPVPYWLSQGTALGAARNGGLIPHDMDVDVTVPDEYIKSGHAYEVLLKHIDRHYSGLFALVRRGQDDWKSFSKELHVPPNLDRNPDPWYTKKPVHYIPMRLFPRAQRGYCAEYGLLQEGLCFHQLDVMQKNNASGFLSDHGGLCDIMFNGAPLTYLVDSPKYLTSRFGANWQIPSKKHDGPNGTIPCAGWEEAWFANEKRLRHLANWAHDLDDDVTSSELFRSLNLRDCESVELPWLHRNRSYE